MSCPLSSVVVVGGDGSGRLVVMNKFQTPLQVLITILYHFIQFGSHASRGPFKTLKCHGSHGNFCKVLNSFGDHMPNIEIFRRLRR